MATTDAVDDEFRSGYLKKRTTGVGGNKWRDRFFVFTSKFELYWFKDQKEWATIRRSGKKKKKDCLTLESSLHAVRNQQLNPTCTDAPTPHCFQILEKEKVILSLCAPDEKEEEEWVELFQEALGGVDITPAKYHILRSLKNNQFRIPPNDLLLHEEETIGAGASGVVKRGVWLKTTDVAIKILKNIPEFLDANESIAFYREMETLSKLRHGSIVQMYGFCQKNNLLCLVTEYVRGGNLSHLLHQSGQGPLEEWYQIDLALNICRGMVYLHSQDVIHRDLKPANILVESIEEGKLKVCDFGLSTVVRTGHIPGTSPEETGMGSPQYAAPELGHPDHGNSVDVFSFSIILWEIATRAHPWPDLKFGSQFAEKYINKERPDIPANNMWKKLIERCWVHNPDQRPRFKDVFADIETLKAGNPRSNKPPVNVGLEQRVERIDKIANQISSIFKDRQSVPWQEFSIAFGNALAVIPADVKSLQYVFEAEGVVTKQTWDTFLLWFSPLKPINSYETEQDDGYDISIILSICTAPYFHAFLGSSEAQQSLKNKTPGTFLIRFSTTNPGSYALSVSYGQSVGHWRISCERKTNCQPVFKVDVREYVSLDELVRIHSPQGEAMKTKNGDSCFLAIPLQRSDAILQ